MPDLDALKRIIADMPLSQRAGKLRSAAGQLGASLTASVGERCEIRAGGSSVLAEVIGFKDGLAHLVPYDTPDRLAPGMPVIPLGSGLSVPVGPGLLGRVVDGLGRPLDGKGALSRVSLASLNAPPPAPLERARIREPFKTGVRAIDGLLTCGRGQRVGIFAGSGVGKSTLLGEIAKAAESEVTILALIGERGREVGPFLEDCLGEQGMARSVVVVATCEQSPLMRVRAAQAALAMADRFRDEGKNVLFMLDSLTRLAQAQREMGLAMGEPPASRGFTPSVFSLLAQTVERLGNGPVGSVTALLTVLVDGDDLDEPVTDAVRSLVDGHIVLERRLAERGHYPAISVGKSISRTATDVIDEEHRRDARALRAILAEHAGAEDLIRIGAYARGSSPPVDRAIELMPALERFLKQDVREHSSFEETRAAMREIAARWPF